MRCYLLYNNNGDIIVSADAGYGSEFDEQSVQEKNPDLNVLPITIEQYEMLGYAQTNYKIENGQIVIKT